VIETDGLTYHRTPAQQAKDLERDQDHEAAGTHALRFSHAQIKIRAGPRQPGPPGDRVPPRRPRERRDHSLIAAVVRE
jgi:hypothetical protein